MAEPPFILDADAACEVETVGGKAATLARLRGEGFNVPPFIVITPRAFDASLTDTQRASLRDEATVEAITTTLSALKPSAAVREAIEEAVASHFDAASRLALRSSAVEEDAAGESFAGQFVSLLNVVPDDVAERVAEVWQGAFTERVRRYRQQLGLNGCPTAPAVIVQPMVDATAAGVAFSADAGQGRRTVSVVSAVYGLGEKLVGGESHGETWHVDRQDRIVEHTSAPDDESATGLSGQAIQQIARLARDVAQCFDRPQDIEWAMRDGELFLLQARPITTLEALPDPDGVEQVWDNANIIESYSGITTPLTFSFARRAYEGVYRQFCLIMGVPQRTIDANAALFGNMLGLIRGRVYYNLLSWYRMLALLPGFTVNRRFMEQMMGVREGLPETVFDEVESTRAGRGLDALRLMRTGLGMLGNYLTLPRKVRYFYQRLNDALAEPDPPLSALRADELVAEYRRLEHRLLTRWDAPLINDFFTMIAYGLLGTLTRRWCDDTSQSLRNELLAAAGEVISTEPARRIETMARLAADDASLTEALCNAPARTCQQMIEQHPALQNEWRQYLDRFGDRCMEELKLETPTLRDDPTPLLRAVGRTARRDRAGNQRPTARPDSLRRQAESKVEQALRGMPMRRLVFRRVLRAARQRVQTRENLRFERTRVFGRVRRILVELGRRLYGEGKLDAPADVFYLELDELLGFVEGHATTTDLRELAATRQHEFAQHQRAPAPADRFHTHGAVHIGNSFAGAELADETEPAATWTGVGCASGVVRGRARIIHDPTNVQLNGDEILVAEHTDPGWVILFPAARGVLVERGSLLSHSAIVAREMGVPTIVGLAGITRAIEDGQWLEMDGAAGTVRRADVEA